MNWSRRFLRTAALAAIFALGLAGTALAAEKKWTGATDNKWSVAGNWDNGVPADGDTAIIEGAVVSVNDATATAKVVSLGQGATLSIEGTGKLTLAAGGALHASGDATVEVKAADRLAFTTATNIAVSADKKLTLKGVATGITGGGNALTLEGGGMLVLETPGSVVQKLVIADGVLTLAEGVKIGNGSPTAPDGAVDLKDKGQLVLNGNLTLKDLKTAGGSKITANGKTLTVINPTSPFVLDAEIDKGTLSLDVLPGQTATLSKDVANVVFNGKSGGAPTLKIEERVFVNHLDIRGSTTKPAKLQFGGENIIGTLKFVRTTTPLVVSYGTLFVTVEKLILADGAALEVSGGTALTIKDGTPGKNWKVTMGNTGTDFRVGSAGLLSGNVEVTLGGGTLYLPYGAYPNLILKADSPSVNPTIDAEFFEGDPVLTVGKVDINNSNLRVKATGVWRHGLKAGDTLTLLEVNETNLSDGKVISGDPDVDSNGYWKWKWERLEGTKTKLVLTALKTISVPDLVAEASYSGNKCTVNVKVSGDVKVNESNWNADMILGDRPENDPAYKNPRTGSEKGAVFEVILPSGFTSGTLRVKATNKEGGNFQGFVDVPLERTTPGGEGNGNDEADKPVEIDNTSWTATALTGESGDVTLRAKIKLVGTPKSLKVEVSGMKTPKAELLDAAGKVVLTSSIPSVRASAKDYTLKLTCRTTKAEIAAGAEIKTVIVTMANGTEYKIPVNKKLKGMKPATSDDNKQPDNGKKPDDGKKPGDGNKPDDGNKPGDDNKPGEGKNGGSGGGCDAGFGGLALALAALFLPRRKV